jgi:hypothetical protein
VLNSESDKFPSSKCSPTHHTSSLLAHAHCVMLICRTTRSVQSPFGSSKSCRNYSCFLVVTNNHVKAAQSGSWNNACRAQTESIYFNQHAVTIQNRSIFRIVSIYHVQFKRIPQGGDRFVQ